MGNLRKSVTTVGLLLILSACSSPSPSPSTAPSAAASSDAPTAAPPTGAVVASGSFVSDTGAPVGDVEIRTAPDDMYELVLSDYVPVPEQVTARAIPGQITFDGCYDATEQFSTGELSSEPEQTFPLGDLTELPFGLDFDTLALVTLTSATAEGECLLRVVAIADLTWVPAG